jgi:hypothetical protein
MALAPWEGRIDGDLVAMFGARPVVHHLLRRLLPAAILGLLLTASLAAAAGVAAQSLDWVRNPGTGHWYAILHDMTWAEGEAYAVSLGGHLATINDEAEDRWIPATFQEEALAGFNDLDKDGTWVWASGETATYTNWLPDEPYHGGGTSDVLLLNFDDNGAYGWLALPIELTVDLGLLIEVVSPVAPPAEMPTATPTATRTAPPTATPTAPTKPTPTAPPPTPSPVPSPAASASPQSSPGSGGIGPGGGGSGGGGGGPGPLVPGITTHIPTPAGISTDASVIEANLLLTGLVVLALVIATELLNRSLGEVQGAMSGPLAIVRRFQRALVRLDNATLQRLARRHRRLADVARLGGIGAFYGLAFALLDPTWDPLSITGAWLVLVMAVAAGVVGLAGDIAAWAVGRRWGVVGDLEIRAGGLLAAIGSTLVSRVVVLSPGLMIGSPEAIDIDPDRIDQRRLGIIGAAGVGTVLLIGFTAWALTLGTAALRGTSPGLDVALGGADAFLLLVFAFAVQNGFVQLLSVRQSAGLALRRTHGQVWGIALLVVTFAFWHTLVNPGGDVATALRSTNALAFLVTAGVALVLSLAVWIGTTLARRRATVVVLPATAIVEAAESTALRDIDLQRTFKHGPKALAERLGIDTGRAKALRWHLGIDRDPACRHDFVFGRMKVPRYSDRAIERMREAIASGANLDGVRRAHQAAGRP